MNKVYDSDKNLICIYIYITFYSVWNNVSVSILWYWLILEPLPQISRYCRSGETTFTGNYGSPLTGQIQYETTCFIIRH